MDLLTQFRNTTEAINLHRDRRGRRYSKTAKRLAIRYCRECRQEGGSFSEIAEALGINIATLGRWLEADEAVDAPRPEFRPVMVAGDKKDLVQKSAEMSLALPNGIRIEGLGVGEVVELLRVLS